ncbi:MAG: tRNA 2-thiouridine(34) synthase MnmA [Mageeibacillus sp.]|jgi:tRNA-specific 2-thiouridylase|nr:tRNA 2-thiouridine(34) synthase MnmA [Mageeibacillus sp.]MCI1264666.1 tRNA 2-thiouridine(34) synthase MnmA [Saccharofermentans sp.]MCI1769808.1 tRNA 2-thiouridine(34) synthase MnmA [Mageeibacillus sp.]MCI2044691.1 tRNA 2-thiouridine(34) synthase MnmA [Mageeibacillus sp.]
MINENRQKALIAMSGGVDSSVAAFLAVSSGYEAIGSIMRLIDKNSDDENDARSVSEKLGMDFVAFDFRKEFRQSVISRFIDEYRRGRTPNPCIYCNRSLKFGLLTDECDRLGAGYIVTGHYARVVFDGNSGRYLLLKGKEAAKDQSYVLYNLTQEQLSRVIFPLGELRKEAVREIAAARGFVNSRKKDSQDICFVPDGDYAGFIRSESGLVFEPGNYVTASGEILGTHRGIINYTIGQRKGLGVALGHPVFVTGIRPNTNEVVLGPEKDLMKDVIYADEFNWIFCDSNRLPGVIRCCARIRYHAAEQPCTVTPTGDSTVRIVFDAQQRAPTPGQSVVLYDGDCCLGGGTIISK